MFYCTATRAFLGFFLCVSLSSSSCADEPAGGNSRDVSAADQIKGEWALYNDTPNGRYMTIKEHLGDRTVVTTYDPKGNVISSHRSEYTVDDSGNANVFRYRNKVVLVGPNAGAKNPRESAYIFRVEGDRFFEVHGMLPRDTGRPSLRVWERLKNSPIPKPKA